MRHGSVIGDVARILKVLRKHSLSDNQVLPTVAILQLGAARLIPTGLLESAEKLLGSLVPDESAVTDDSRFARSVTGIARKFNGSSQTVLNIWMSLEDQNIRALLTDPLLLGWLHQILIKERSSTFRESGQIAPQDIASSTQWFTPGWIAEFLIGETIERFARGGGGAQEPLFLDPACGAGHILIPALEPLVAHHMQRECGPEQALTRALDQVHGLEIDADMIELSAFAIYLTARGICRNPIELPIPKLFQCRRKGVAEFSEGSLLLRGNRVDVEFVSPIGAKMSSREFPAKFDAIAANPPYLSRRVMPDALADFLQEHFECARHDLYAAFLELTADLLGDRGRLAMICQQSFLSIQRYQPLRTSLAKKADLCAVVQLGPGSFAAKGGEKVNNAIVIFEKSDAKSKHSGEVRCWRLLSASEKENAEQQGLAQLEPQILQFPHINGLSNAFSNAPYIFWCPPGIGKLFGEYPPMQSDPTGIVCCNGLFTCDNRRFVKLRSAVGESELRDYVPYDKGGGHKWFRTTPYMLRWIENGDEIRAFRKSRGQSESLPGEDYYFKPGVTYSYIGTKGFRARLLSPNSIFDIASSSVFGGDIDDLYILGFLNSSLVCFMLGVLNPTINFQIGDLRRLPFLIPDRKLTNAIVKLSGEAVQLAQQAEELETSVACSASSNNRNSKLTPEQYRHLVDAINSREESIQREIDSVIFNAYKISESTRLTILADPWVSRSRQPLCKLVTPKKFHAYAD